MTRNYETVKELDQVPVREDAFTTYLADMRSHGLMSREQEVDAFQLKEERETALFQAMAGSRHFAEAARSLSADMSGTDEDGAEALLRISGLPAKDAAPALAEACRSHNSVSDRIGDLCSTVAGLEADGRSSQLLALAARLRESKGAILTSNLRFVVYVAKRYRPGRTMSFSDLVQEGNIGMMRAIDKFDWRRGVKFTSYAGWWVRQSIRRSMADKERLIRLPVHVAERITRIRRIDQVHQTQTGKEVPKDELMRSLGMSDRAMGPILEARLSSVVSFDAPLAQDPDSGPRIEAFASSMPGPADILQSKQLRDELASSMSVLSQVERRVIAWRFALDGGDPLTLQEIADKYGLSRERIRQLEAQALKKLRKYSGRRLMDNLLR